MLLAVHKSFLAPARSWFMLREMALLDTLIKKFGPEQGRLRFNRYHRLYRKRNKPRMLKYWKDRREAQKASIGAASGGL